MLPLKHPFNLLCAGPTLAGKSSFITDLVNNIQNGSVAPRIEKVIWCHAELNARPSGVLFENISYRNGIPDKFENNENIPTLIVLDDFMLEANSSARICDLFTKGSHHRNLSVILITQNIFHRGSFSRDISLNSKYLVVFKNPRDRSQFSHLARQIYPENPSELLRVYKEATLLPHGYLLIDLAQDTLEALRFRTNIFNEDYSIVYCPMELLMESNGISNQKIGEEQAFIIRIT